MLEAICIGGRSTLTRPTGSAIETGIMKEPTVTEAHVGPDGVAGDVIVHTSVHGGVDQAVYVYTRADYDWWEVLLERELPAGQFGENLTIAAFEHDPVRIGDRLTVGEVELEITAPRIPCATFATKMGEPGWLQTFRAARRPGAYCRVIVPGTVRTGDPVTHAAGDPAHITLVELFDLHYDVQAEPGAVAAALDSPVAERTRRMLEDRLARRG